MKENKFWWSDENVAILKERYQIDGPKKLAEVLRTTPPSVILKARRLKIPPKNGENHEPWEWSEWEIKTLKERYPTDDIKELARQMGMPLYVLQRGARKLGIKNLTGRERAGQKNANNNKSCDVHYFDEWSEGMAWTLGFLFADGSITKRQCEVVTYVAVKDIEVLEYIKKQTKSTRKFDKLKANRSKDGNTRQDAYGLILGSTILVKKVMELGLKPSKTYNDDPFPNVPDNMMPHFVRGYLDGDGSIYVTNQDVCRIGFIGSPKFITGLRDSLVRLAGMKEKKVGVEQYKRAKCGRVIWAAKDDITKFYNFAYVSPKSFCLKRKKNRLEDWLLDKGVRI